MATTTTNLGLTKPALSESADVGVINDNSDKIDVEAGKARANMAATYSDSSAYAVGAYCERGGNLYRCTTAIASGGEAWNSGHWTQVAVTGEIPKVVDNLTSTSTSNALSAKQGKVLNEKATATQPSTGISDVTANKVGSLVVLSISVSTSISTTSAGWKELGTLPEGLRPASTIIANLIDNNANNRQNSNLECRVNSSGKISVYLFANESAKPYGQIVYFV